MTSPKPSRAPVVVMVLAVGLPLFLIARSASSDRGGGAMAVAPSEVLGTWRTDDPRYAGRSIAILQDRIVLGLGEDEPPVMGRVREVRARTTGDLTVVLVTYAVSGELFELDMMLDGTGAMYLRHPARVAWFRRE